MEKPLPNPCFPGTNRAAIEAGADIIAHPGLITEDDANLAKSNNVRLEISGRKGHSYANGHVVKVAKKAGVKLVLVPIHIPLTIYWNVNRQNA